MLVELIGAHTDPDLPFEIDMSDELLVEADAPVSYLTPMSVRRTASTAAAIDDALMRSEGARRV